MKNYSVIVSPVRLTDNGSYRITGNRTVDEEYDDYVTAMKRGLDCIAFGMSVIVRPNFNEEKFYREWRSFDGKPFEEVKWDHLYLETDTL